MIQSELHPLRLKADPVPSRRAPLSPGMAGFEIGPGPSWKAGRPGTDTRAIGKSGASFSMSWPISNSGTGRPARFSSGASARSAGLLNLSLQGIGDKRQQLIGAYFCQEYSYAAAALMNPSVVPHPDQSGLDQHTTRFLMSLRAVGEGHISSIAFREGLVSDNGGLELAPEPPFAVAADAPNLDTLSGDCAVTVYRSEDANLSGTVIFPVTPAQSNGLEDLRLTYFTHDDGSTEYFGTYTAFSGREIRSELLRTRDFRSAELVPMTGDATRNKGLALFPKKSAAAT